MLSSTNYQLKCRACSKEFSATNAYTRHVNTCPVLLAQEAREPAKPASLSQRLRLGSARAKAGMNLKAIKDRVTFKKRPRLDSASTFASNRTHDIPLDSQAVRSSASQIFPAEEVSLSNEDSVRASDEPPEASAHSTPSPASPNPTPSGVQRHSTPPAHSEHAEELPARRRWRPSARLRLALDDALPEGPNQLFQRLDSTTNQRIDEAEHVLHSPQAKTLPKVILHVHEKIRTLPNRFGLSRIYRRRPAGPIPDASLPFDRRVDTPAPRLRRLRRAVKDIIFPYPNISAFLIGRWHEKGSAKKTLSEREELQKVLLDPRFDREDLRGVDFGKIDRLLAQDVQSPAGGSGWRDGSVVFDVPSGQKDSKAAKQQRQQDAASAQRSGLSVAGKPRLQYHLDHVYTRSLTHIMRSVVEEDPASREFHWQPFTEHWTPPYAGAQEEEVMGELYASQAFRDAERDVLALPRASPDDDLPRGIFAFMFWSDATHVSQVGNTKVWPGYAFIGNQSMYVRSKPSARAAHHFVYFPTLDDSFEDFLARNHVHATPHLLAHCRRELFHGVWHLVLDEEFLKAYEDGLVLKCMDGVTRRIYPRIFTYSADYPEKVLIATTRDMGSCPCTRCTIPKDAIRGLGTDEDRTRRRDSARKDDQQRREKIESAREALDDGFVVNSARIEQMLKPESYVPTRNAFSQPALTDRHLNVFSMLVPDKMHEFDLGVWKSLLVHVVRILESLPAEKLKVFNARFRQIPTFGRDKIRRFARNVSELSRMAARDYEDILLCIMPCLEGLLPSEDGESITDLLYLMNYWHSLASLRMHTSSTVKILDNLTTELGKALRYFADITCSHFQTRETAKEYGKRQRAESRRTASLGRASSNPQGHSEAANASGHAAAPTSQGRRPKTFSLGMIKLHFLGDYADAIRRYGSLDHFSTKTGELEHRVVKRRRARTGHSGFIPQLVKAETRERVHDRMYEELRALEKDEPVNAAAKKRGAERRSGEPRGRAMADVGATADELRHHHHIAEDESGERLYLASWLTANKSDPALQFFMRKLRGHLLSQLEGCSDAENEPAYPDDELLQVVIQNDRIFPHATFSVNYTTYDVRRDQDLVHVPPASSQPPREDYLGHRDVMVNASAPAGHPFAYARVLKVFHAQITHAALSPEPRRVEFLWVRWLSTDIAAPSGPTALRLERLQYRHGHSAFGFVDPRHVVRGCHLIPAFHYGRTRGILELSAYRDSVEGDWAKYYVGRFVDRDMMMRYLGAGVGHLNPPTFPHELDQVISVRDSEGLRDSPHSEEEQEFPDEDISDESTTSISDIDEDVYSDDE